jgi:hypothetical protein
LLVTDAGVTEVDVSGNLIGGVTDILYDRGRVYSTSGHVVDPEAYIVLGRFPFPSFDDYGQTMATDSDRAYYLTKNFFYGAITLREFDSAPSSSEPAGAGRQRYAEQPGPLGVDGSLPHRGPGAAAHAHS